MIFKGFIGGAYKGRSTYLNPQTCINLFPIVDKTGGKNVTALIGTPGLRKLAEHSTAATVRGMRYAGGVLYAIIGADFCSVSASWAITVLGTLDTTSGPVELEYNGNQVMVIDDTFGYTFTVATAVFAKITDADFPVPGSLTYQDGYFIVTKAGTDEFYISASYDGTAWDALDFASAESQPDAAVAIVSDHRELWIFGEDTVEVYFNSGNADFPFDRITGSIQEVGCGAKHSIAKGDNTLFWFDNRGFVVRANGYNHSIISTRNVEYQWAQYADTSDAIGVCLTFEGHVWYQITFPTARKTWVYDVATDMWHERESYNASGGQAQHRMYSYAYAYGVHVAGDYENGCVYAIDMDTFTDNGEKIIRERTCPVFANENNVLVFHSLEIDHAPGSGDLITDPQLMLSWSDDGGKTWGNELWRGLGKAGEYKNRAVWFQLGMARNRVFRVRISDSFRVELVGAYLLVSKVSR